MPPFDGGTETAVELLVRNQAVDNQISVEDVRERIRENFPPGRPPSLRRRWPRPACRRMTA